MLTYLKEDKIKISLILCHDGNLFGIYDVAPEFPDIYYRHLEMAKKRTSDLDEAKRLATTRMYLLNDRLGKSHKLFTFEKL